jgi:hypothetical protein
MYIEHLKPCRLDPGSWMFCISMMSVVSMVYIEFLKSVRTRDYIYNK